MYIYTHTRVTNETFKHATLEKAAKLPIARKMNFSDAHSHSMHIDEVLRDCRMHDDRAGELTLCQICRALKSRGQNVYYCFHFAPPIYKKKSFGLNTSKTKPAENYPIA